MDEKTIAKYNNSLEKKGRSHIFTREMSEKEQQFVDLFKRTGGKSASWCVRQVWGNDISMRTVGRKASVLMKRFNLISDRKRTMTRPVTVRNTNDAKERIVATVKKKLMSGQISEAECFDEMSRLAFRSVDDRVRFMADKELREWIKDAQQELKANELAEEEVVNLLIRALSDLPQAKYYEVLAGIRAHRRFLAQEKVKKPDAEAIIRHEREKMAGSGDTVPLDDQVEAKI
jgi:predicted transcriptional regulator